MRSFWIIVRNAVISWIWGISQSNNLCYLDVDSNILAEHVTTRRMADGRVVEETTFVIDPHSSGSDNSSSDGDSGGEDVGENSDDDEGDDDERAGDDETMVITFEDTGDNDDHDEHGDDDEEDEEDDDDDDDDDDEDEISSVNRPEGLFNNYCCKS